MRSVVVVFVFLFSITSYASSSFKDCDKYLNKRVKSFPMSPSGHQYTKIDLFQICTEAKPGFVECQKIVDDAHGSNRLFVSSCIQAQSGIKDCVKIYNKRFTHPSRTYSAENDLDAAIRICNGEIELDRLLTKLKD